MRTISAAAQTVLDAKLEIEPVIAVDIQWTDGGKWYQYAEKQLTNGSGRIVKGIINQVDGLDNVIVIQSVMTGTAGDSQSLTLTLDDTSGELKEIVMNNDVHKRSVKVYLYLEGTDFDADRIWLFTGELSTPIEWNEGTRTLTVNIINKIEDAEVGFSIEEGDFYLPPQELIGKAWPLCFGKCIHIPALRVKSPLRGILKTGFGVADFMLPHLAKQIGAVCCPRHFAGYTAKYVGEWWRPSLQISPVYKVDRGCWCKKQNDAIAALNAYELQKQYEYEELEISGGKQFPQDRRIWLVADGAEFYGYFMGSQYVPSETFKVLNYKHPKVDEVIVPEYASGWRLCGADAPTHFENGIPVYENLVQPNYGLAYRCEEIDKEKSNTGWDYVAAYPRADFFWVQPGTEVYQRDNEGDSVHVVNLLPSTIYRVAAWKQYDFGLRELATVPKSYYTTRVSDMNGYSVQEIVLLKPLRFYDEGWEEDQLYVSFKSTVGPNMVDEMIWLINKYTNLSYDASNFAAIKSQLAVYRNNYPILERKNIIDVLRTMAFNNRCALILRDNEFKLIYLGADPTSAITITESDIIPKSLRIGHTSTEDLVTKVNGVWRDDYAYDEKKYVCRFNVKKYGTMEDTFEFPCFNIYGWVVKSNTFWMIRMANTWKRITFQTYMDKIAIEVLDCITVNLPDFNPNPIKCIVENATYNSNDHLLEIECWTPIRAGENEPFPYAWPKEIRVDQLWPTANDILAGFGGGSGPNIDVRAPSGHALDGKGQKFFSGFSLSEDEVNKGPCEATSIGFRPISCRPDHGDTQPSDIDDTDTEVKAPGEDDTQDGNDAKGGYGKVENFKLTEEGWKEMTQEEAALRHAQNAGTQTGEQDKPTEPDPNDTCDDIPDASDQFDMNDKPDCLVVVSVGYLRPVNSVFIPGEGTSSKPGDKGKANEDQPDANYNKNEYYFNSKNAAQAFHDKIKEKACGFEAVVGGIWPACSTIALDIKFSGTWAFGKHDNGKQSGTALNEPCEEPDNPRMVAKDESRGGGRPTNIGGETSTGLCTGLNPGEQEGAYGGTTMDWASA